MLQCIAFQLNNYVVGEFCVAKSNWHYVVEALVTFDSTSNLLAELPSSSVVIVIIICSSLPALSLPQKETVVQLLKCLMNAKLMYFD